ERNVHVRRSRIGLLDPRHAVGDHYLEFGRLDRPCAFRKFIERKEAALPGALQKSVGVEAGDRSASEIRGDRAPGVPQYGPPAIARPGEDDRDGSGADRDRKSTRLNSSHVKLSYAVFCLKK